MVHVLVTKADLQVSQISETTEGIFSDAFYLVALDESVQNGLSVWRGSKSSHKSKIYK